MRLISRTTLAVIVASMSTFTPAAFSENTERELIMSCTYGVLAGTLVGAASLAFTDKPGDHLNKVARGASLGLYAGILLGLYVVYVVPGQEDDSYDGIEKSSNVLVYPTLSSRGLDGAAVDWVITRF